MSYFEHITHPLLIQSYTFLFFVSFTFCLLIILSSGYGFNRRASKDEVAVQSAHSGFVPRVGGLAIYLSIFAVIPLSTYGFIPISVVFQFETSTISWLAFSAVPVF